MGAPGIVRMPVLRTDIERALEDLISQEEGMRFQGLAVVLGKMRWPRLVARPRKKDMGLDAYVPAWDTEEKIGIGLAASITPDLTKVSSDAERAKEELPGPGCPCLRDARQNRNGKTETVGRGDSERPRPRTARHRARGNPRTDDDAWKRIALRQLSSPECRDRA